MLNVLDSIAQFDRELMLERQREGIAGAKAGGEYKGRLAIAQRQAAPIAMRQQGQKPEAIARELGISRARFGRSGRGGGDEGPQERESLMAAARGSASKKSKFGSRRLPERNE